MRKLSLNTCIAKYLVLPKTGRSCRFPYRAIVSAILYKLKTGMQWFLLPMRQFFKNRKYSWQSVYYHYNKWCKSGEWERIYYAILRENKADLNLSSVNLDGTHTPAKKGGKKVAYQGRKKAKTSNLLLLTDASGIPLAISQTISGNHNDAYRLKQVALEMFATMERQSIPVKGLVLNANSGFDVQKFKLVCYQKDILYNIKPNPRNNKNYNEDEHYIFDNQLYKGRFVLEQCNAWVDAYKNMLVRFETSAQNWRQAHFIVFAAIFLRRAKKISFCF